jgi:hypothetical protein
MSSLRFVFALTCPALAFVSPVLSNRAGFSLFWQLIFFGVFILLGIAVTAKSKSNRPLCQGRTKNGEPCKHRVGAGEKFCVQHLEGFRAKLRAVPRSKTKAFWFNFGGNAVSIVLTIALYVAGLPPKPLIAAPSPPTGLTGTLQ